MHNNITEQHSTAILQIFDAVVKQYERNEEVVKQSEGEIQDLLHEIELGSDRDMYKGYLLYKEIRNVRRRRREAKDANQLLQDMYDFFLSQQGAAFKKKIQQLQGNSVKAYEAQNRRTYTPRQRDDLTITNTHNTTPKDFEEMVAEFNQKNKITREKGKWRK